MKVERSIGAGPRRSTEQACVGIAEFIIRTLHDRKYPDVAQVRSRFEQLFPLLRFLLTTRGLARPAITIATPGLHIDIVVSYDPEFKEDLTPPNLVLLDSLAAVEVIGISIHSAEKVAGRLRSLPAAVSTDTIRFELTHSADSVPEADITPHADKVPDDTAEADAVPEAQDDDDTYWPNIRDKPVPPDSE